MRSFFGVVLAVPMILLGAGAATAARPEVSTVVQHDVTFTASFPDDICGPRANTTTFTGTVDQVHYLARADGTFLYRDVAVVTYVADYDDPTLPDLSGRLTEVNHFVLTPGDTFNGTTTFHDFAGDLRIFVRVHVTEVKGSVVVNREFVSFTGCP